MIQQQNSTQHSHEIQQIMKLSYDLAAFINKTYNHFGDIQLLIGKYLTPLSFWFIIDSLYYGKDIKKYIKQLQLKRKYKLSNIQDFSQYQDLQYILKIRKLLINQNHGTFNLQSIKNTSIDQVIIIANKYLHQLQINNNNKISFIQNLQYQQQQLVKIQLNKFNIKLKQTHPMFIYQQLQQQLKEQILVSSSKINKKLKCYLCSLPNKLLTCIVNIYYNKRCSFTIHQYCYPTFYFKFDHGNKNVYQSNEFLPFICENCNHGVDFFHQQCQLCCCTGGYFVKISSQNQLYNYKIKLQKNPSQQSPKYSQLTLKILPTPPSQKRSQYIHLTCFIWNKQLKWNEKTNEVDNMSRVEKKKINGTCSLCGISFGIVVPCSNQYCRRVYHAECAKRHGLQMSIIRAKNNIIDLFCQRHRHLNRYQSLQQSKLTKFREIKKMLDIFDKQLKRMNISASFHQVKLVAERQFCMICGKQQGWEKIIMCKQCRKWYHVNCSGQCKNCV